MHILVTIALLHYSSISLLVLVILAQFEGFGEIQDGSCEESITEFVRHMTSSSYFESK